VTYGIDAASRYYFNVAAKDLTLGQAATLAGIVQNPNTYRIDKPEGSVFNQDGVGFNRAPDGLIDDVNEGQLAALDSALAESTQAVRRIRSTTLWPSRTAQALRSFVGF